MHAALPLLNVKSVVKSFPGVRALKGVSLTLNAGEVLAVLGENGAGKSTLMKILAGIQTPDAGAIEVDGVAAEIGSVQQALDLGIALIHQELNLADNLTVGANIYLGREPRRFGLIDHRAIRRNSRDFLAKVGLDVSPRLPVHQLSIGHQQLVEIAKALSTNARVLIMDEPTSSLSQHETENLFRVVKDLRSKGVAIVYISHRLGEVKELADRVVVLRDGENAGEIPREEITHDRMVRMMVGRDVSQLYPLKPHTAGDVVLEVDGIATPANPRHSVSFAIKKGEIVGMAGLVGAGRTELLRAIFGIDRPLRGTVRVEGKALTQHTPIEAIDAGIALVPEDRKQEGLVLEMSVRENVGLAGLKQHAKAGLFLDHGAESRDATRAMESLRIKTPSAKQIVQLLSGGNQQKVVLGKWLALHPKVLLLDEPTRGIDIGAKQEIYRLMEELASKGMAILFVSSEMEEVLGMSSRALVMHEGKITGELRREELSEEAVMHLATGGDSVHS